MSAHTAPPPASRPSPALGQAATTPRGDGRVYLDYAASAPVRPQVAEQVAQDLGSGLGGWASPSAQHASGRRASALLSQARARVAQALGAGPHEVLFTSGGSEADSLAVIGRVMAARAAGVERPQVVISGVEHPAVADSARVAQSLGAELTVLGVDAAGRVDPARAASALDPGRTALVSVMTANNETGVVQDVAGIVSAVRQASPGRVVAALNGSRSTRMPWPPSLTCPLTLMPGTWTRYPCPGTSSGTSRRRRARPAP